MYCRVTALDAVVFGHLFAIVTTVLPNNCLSVVIKDFDNLQQFLRRVNETYFSDVKVASPQIHARWRWPGKLWIQKNRIQVRCAHHFLLYLFLLSAFTSSSTIDIKMMGQFILGTQHEDYAPIAPIVFFIVDNRLKRKHIY